MQELAGRVAQVRQRIDAACRAAGRRSESVQLIAVTKTCAPTVLAELTALGIADYGENRVEHLELMAAVRPPGARFHYIGRVQSRQFAQLLPHCASLHSLCEAGHPARLAAACRKAGIGRFPVFIQVNTAGEAQKAGLAPTALPAFLDEVRACAELELRGLMTMAPDLDLPGVGTDQVRRCFAGLRELAVRHGVQELSMGMSQDYAWAIAEGATQVRLGSVLVGGG
jgi:PLP dependent protein